MKQILPMMAILFACLVFLPESTAKAAATPIFVEVITSADSEVPPMAENAVQTQIEEKKTCIDIVTPKAGNSAATNATMEPQTRVSTLSATANNRATLSKAHTILTLTYYDATPTAAAANNEQRADQPEGHLLLLRTLPQGVVA